MPCWSTWPRESHTFSNQALTSLGNSSTFSPSVSLLGAFCGYLMFISIKWLKPPGKLPTECQQDQELMLYCRNSLSARVS